MLSESELYLKVVPMDWIIFFVILGYLKMLDIWHALDSIQPSGDRPNLMLAQVQVFGP